MEYIGCLICFLAGAAVARFCLTPQKQPPKHDPVLEELPEPSESELKQYLNFISYDGTESGQLPLGKEN